MKLTGKEKKAKKERMEQELKKIAKYERNGRLILAGALAFVVAFPIFAHSINKNELETNLAESLSSKSVNYELAGHRVSPETDDYQMGTNFGANVFYKVSKDDKTYMVEVNRQKQVVQKIDVTDDEDGFYKKYNVEK